MVVNTCFLSLFINAGSLACGLMSTEGADRKLAGLCSRKPARQGQVSGRFPWRLFLLLFCVVDKKVKKIKLSHRI